MGLFFYCIKTLINVQYCRVISSLHLSKIIFHWGLVANNFINGCPDGRSCGSFIIAKECNVKNNAPALLKDSIVQCQGMIFVWNLNMHALKKGKYQLFALNGSRVKTNLIHELIYFSAPQQHTRKTTNTQNFKSNGW